MTPIILLALVSAAFAHWPYADLEHKFRMSSIAIAGNGHDLDTQYAWIFSPMNNQRQLTFQLRFPRKLVSYTLQLSHVAEVKPTSGIFQLVPSSAINFNDAKWFPSSGNWFYDEETFGEVVMLTLQPYSQKLDDLWDVSLLLKIYPDSQDDLIDVKIMFNDYQFVGDPEVDDVSTQYAIFFKVVSSTGEEAELRNLPLSVDWDLIKFEVNSEVLIDDPEVKHPTRNGTSSKKSSKHTKKAATTFETKEEAEDFKALLRTRSRPASAPSHETTAQLWFTGGYIAAVVGIIPGDYTGGAVWTVVTLSLRTPHAKLY